MEEIMTDKDLIILEYLMCRNQEQKKSFVDNYLKKIFTEDRCIITEAYSVALGDIPVGLVAHLDSVFEETKVYKNLIHLYYDQRKRVAFCPGTGGFDDAAGIFGILKLLTKGYRPTIIFTTDEELCCKGVQQLVKDIPNCPVPLKYIIELDRQGQDDAVFYDCDNRDFIDYIEEKLFNFNVGSYSDISVIGPAWGIACVNLSIGYLDEHSYREILRTDWFEETIEKVENLLSLATRKDVPSFKYIPLEWKKEVPLVDYPREF